jgi:YVTN family beta-propeller protein
MKVFLEKTWLHWIGIIALGLFVQTAQAEKAYVANAKSSTITVMDDYSVVSTITVGSAPQSLVANPASTRIYVMNTGDNTVSVIDVANNNVVATIPVGISPRYAVVNIYGTRVYVSNLGGNSISVIDTSSNTVISNISIGAPLGMVLNSTSTRLYVVNQINDGTVSIIDTDTNKIISTVAVGNNPAFITLSPDETKFYVTNWGTDTVSTIDIANNTVSTITVGDSPYGITMNSSGTRVYVANELSSSVSVIDTSTNTVVTTIPVGVKPAIPTLNAAGTLLYVTDLAGGAVSIIDTTVGQKVSDSTLSKSKAIGGDIMVLSTPSLCSTPATYNLSTRTVDIPAIDIVALSPITGAPSNEISVFSVKLQQMTGVEDFKIIPESLMFIDSVTKYNPNHARYEYSTGIFNNGGTVQLCVSVPNVIVSPLNAVIATPSKKYNVTLRQLAVYPDVFHVESIVPVTSP